MTAELEGVLRGVKVLVVEDEFLVAALIEDMLHTAGCIVTGPIPRLGEALDAVDRGTYDAAILSQAGFTNVASLSGGIDRWSLAVDPNMPRY